MESGLRFERFEIFEEQRLIESNLPDIPNLVPLGEVILYTTLDYCDLDWTVLEDTCLMNPGAEWELIREWTSICPGNHFSPCLLMRG
eukprot:1345356-Amorphochlora_amoeboformis.AAC.1